MLEIEGLTVTYPGSAAAVQNLSLSIKEGETLALIGRSGSGKSSVALALMRLLGDAKLSGKILFEGIELLSLSEKEMRAFRRKKMGIVFQDALDALNPTMTIGRQLAEALERPTKEQITALLKRAEIPDPERCRTAYPFQLSGGMRQRVLIAIALAANPRLLIADEPTTALDPTIQAQILELLQSLQKELGMALLLITHDLGVAARMADRAAVMEEGKLIETAAIESLFSRPQHPVSRTMIRRQQELYGCSQ